MAHYGIDVEKTFGVNVPKLRAIAKQTRLDSARLVGKNHTLAQELWQSGYHEARHIAAMIDDPKLVSKTQMNRWAHDFNSWDICDGTCSNLFRKTPFAFEKIFEWCERKEEYVRRAGFSLMAYLAVHDKKREEKDFLQFFPLIKR